MHSFDFQILARATRNSLRPVNTHTHRRLASRSLPPSLSLAARSLALAARRRLESFAYHDLSEARKLQKICELAAREVVCDV